MLTASLQSPGATINEPMFDKDVPAFPVQDAAAWQAHGMTLRQYAAITLKVPDSGTQWLDDMIRSSLHDQFAAQVLAGLMAHKFTKDHLHRPFVEWATEFANEAAAAMLSERAK